MKSSFLHGLLLVALFGSCFSTLDCGTESKSLPHSDSVLIESPDDLSDDFLKNTEDALRFYVYFGLALTAINEIVASTPRNSWLHFSYDRRNSSRIATQFTSLLPRPPPSLA